MVCSRGQGPACCLATRYGHCGRRFRVLDPRSGRKSSCVPCSTTASSSRSLRVVWNLPRLVPLLSEAALHAPERACLRRFSATTEGRLTDNYAASFAEYSRLALPCSHVALTGFLRKTSHASSVKNGSVLILPLALRRAAGELSRGGCAARRGRSGARIRQGGCRGARAYEFRAFLAMIHSRLAAFAALQGVLFFELHQLEQYFRFLSNPHARALPVRGLTVSRS
jgi:hypothetical protein